MTTNRRRPNAVLFDFFNTIVRRVRFDADVGIAAVFRLAERPPSVSVDDVLARNSTLENSLSDVWDASGRWCMAPLCLTAPMHPGDPIPWLIATRGGSLMAARTKSKVSPISVCDRRL